MSLPLWVPLFEQLMEGLDALRVEAQAVEESDEARPARATVRAVTGHLDVAHRTLRNKVEEARQKVAQSTRMQVTRRTIREG